jgi:hypothetical protein
MNVAEGIGGRRRLSFRGKASARRDGGWPYALACAVRERVMRRRALRQTARLRQGRADLKEIEVL